MKITESITPVNAGKTVLGKCEFELTLNTETAELELNAPAMFTNPVIKLDDLKETIEKLSAYMTRADDGSNQI